MAEFTNCINDYVAEAEECGKAVYYVSSCYVVLCDQED